MIAVVPPDWKFLVLGSRENIAQINSSMGIQLNQADGKLEIKERPQNESYAAQEQRSRLLTDLNFYDKYLPGAEWLLVFHSDSILCANAKSDLDDWLKYDWVGAPW